MTSSSNKMLFVPKPRPGAKLRLFCFHHAGGAAHLFWDWSSYFPEDIEIAAVQLPGRASRTGETLETSFPRLIAQLSQALGPTLD